MFTSDNPVVVNKQGNYGWLLPLEAEIYFPVQKITACFFIMKGPVIKATL